MAMLDILGKACHAPIYRVLGGPTRNKIRAFTDSAEAPGFHAVALRVPPAAARNRGKAYQDQVRALAKLLGDDRDFVLDAHGRLTPGDAASVAAMIESSHPLWFDEPCSVSNLEVVRKISAETVTPLGFGRGIGDPGVFQALLREGLVDVVRPDIWVHGISGTRRIAVLAETYYVASRHTTTAVRWPPRRRCTWRPAFRISSSSTCPVRRLQPTARCAPRLFPPAWRRRAMVFWNFREASVWASM